MHIHIIAVGKLKEKYWRDALSEYHKRLHPYVQVTITEVADEKDPGETSPTEERLIKAREAERIRKAMKKETYLIALAIEGKAHSSEELAAFFAQCPHHGQNHLTLLIGGSLGLAEDLLQEANERWSFSRATFPHQLMRVILLEQIYRSYRIIHGHQYHK